MLNILCFGDSNTFGYVPKTGERYDANTRWTSVLQRVLGENYNIIEAGCNNRTGFVDNIDGEALTGYKLLPKLLEKNPDIVIIALGTNDIQKFYYPSIDMIEKGLYSMIKYVKSVGARVILISPPILNEDVLKGNFAFQFDEKSIEQSKILPDLYQMIANKTGCGFVNLNKHVSVSFQDGLHYSPESHSVIANALADYIKLNFA